MRVWNWRLESVHETRSQFFSSLSCPCLAYLSLHGVFHFLFSRTSALPSASSCGLALLINSSIHTIPKLPALRVSTSTLCSKLWLITTVLLFQFKLLRGIDYLSLGQMCSRCWISLAYSGGTATTKYIAYFCRIYEGSIAKEEKVVWESSHPPQLWHSRIQCFFLSVCLSHTHRKWLNDTWVQLFLVISLLKLKSIHTLGGPIKNADTRARFRDPDWKRYQRFLMSSSGEPA